MKQSTNAGNELGIVCEYFNEATVLFTKVCDFQAYSNKLRAVDIVNLLNLVYSAFDEIIERHGVYKVETIGERCFSSSSQHHQTGESYMISCGVPTITEYHAEYVGDVALDMLETVKRIDFAPIGGKKVQIKIGTPQNALRKAIEQSAQASIAVLLSALSSANARRAFVSSATQSTVRRVWKVIIKW